jgi:predicted ATPase
VELKEQEYVDPPPTLSEMQGRKVARFGLVHIDNVDMIRYEAGPILEKAFSLKANFPDTFASIVRTYIEIFPTVSEVCVEMVGYFDEGRSDTRDGDMLTVGIKETSSNDWIYGEAISSGMWRTLVHLFELELSPPDTVILIDEVENSLGVNCLGAVIDGIRQRSGDIQFIITSHHPYIINNIPIEDWHVVTRRGSVISVKNASEIPALAGHSRVDKFIRLINAPEFEDGVQ